MVVGVLALQGAFAKHLEVLEKLGVKSLNVRRPAELAACDALIIPGGESTAIAKHVRFIGLLDPLIAFGKKKPVFGTCAGMILMARHLELLDVEVKRNGWGPQYESFSKTVETEVGPFPAMFIRAPRIKKWGKNVDVLGKIDKEPILVKQGHLLASTFHPELTDNLSIHRYFLDLIR